MLVWFTFKTFSLPWTLSISLIDFAVRTWPSNSGSLSYRSKLCWGSDSWTILTCLPACGLQNLEIEIRNELKFLLITSHWVWSWFWFCWQLIKLFANKPQSRTERGLIFTFTATSMTLVSISSSCCCCFDHSTFSSVYVLAMVSSTELLICWFTFYIESEICQTTHFIH